MIDPIDTYRAANELIKQHGDAADIEAAMRADERLAAGDMEGEAVWLRIGKAIEELGAGAIQDKCLLWVISRRFAAPSRMSAFGGKADVNHIHPICPLIAKTGHSDPASATWRLQPYRPFPPSVSGLT